MEANLEGWRVALDPGGQPGHAEQVLENTGGSLSQSYTLQALRFALLPIKKTDLKFKITDLKQTLSLPKNRPKTDPTAKQTDLFIIF